MKDIKTIDPISRWELIAEIYDKCTCIHDACTGGDKCEKCYDFCINYDDLVEVIKKMPSVATRKVNITGDNTSFIEHCDTLIL